MCHQHRLSKDEDDWRQDLHSISTDDSTDEQLQSSPSLLRYRSSNGGAHDEHHSDYSPSFNTHCSSNKHKQFKPSPHQQTSVTPLSLCLLPTAAAALPSTSNSIPSNNASNVDSTHINSNKSQVHPSISSPLRCPCSPSSSYYTWNEIRRHNTVVSCWLVVGNKVYDATPFLSKHPAGAQCILRYAATDCIQHFDFHSKRGRQMWKQFEIGRVKNEESMRCAIM